MEGEIMGLARALRILQARFCSPFFRAAFGFLAFWDIATKDEVIGLSGAGHDGVFLFIYSISSEQGQQNDLAKLGKTLFFFVLRVLMKLKMSYSYAFYRAPSLYSECLQMLFRVGSCAGSKSRLIGHKYLCRYVPVTIYLRLSSYRMQLDLGAQARSIEEGSEMLQIPLTLCIC